MYLDVMKIIDEYDGDHEIHIMIVLPGERPSPATYAVSDYTLRRFETLHRFGHYGRALNLLKREGAMRPGIEDKGETRSPKTTEAPQHTEMAAKP